MLEIVLDVTDVRKSFYQDHEKGADVVKVSRKAKKSAEVNWRKIDDDEKKRFGEAKAKEVDSFLANEMLEICKRKGISRERVMKMRWVLTYKSAQVDELGRKVPKARLVILGYQDPDIDDLERESPTLSTTSRTLIFMLAATQKWKLKSGYVKTAFMQ